jgi:hypothetical protein
VKVSEKISQNHSPAVLGLAMIAGLGVILIVLALAIGVVQGNAADSTTIGLLFVSGIALFLLGAGGWYGVTQPQKHFDDINVPMDEFPHGHNEHAIVPAEQHQPVQHH